MHTTYELVKLPLRSPLAREAIRNYYYYCYINKIRNYNEITIIMIITKFRIE